MPASKTARKFYKTEITVTVLSEGPLNPNIELDGIHYAITNGDCSGEVEFGASEEITPKQMAKCLEDQGSDPEFFQLSPEGKELED